MTAGEETKCRMESIGLSGLKIAVLQWEDLDDMANMISYELEALDHCPIIVTRETPIPDGIDLLFTFGPYDKILDIWQHAGQITTGKPVMVAHWNTEGMPDLRIPMPVMKFIGAQRSRVGRMSHSHTDLSRDLANRPPFSWIDNRMHRYRYLGDYAYAYRKGWLHILADSSAIYTQRRNKYGIPTLYAPWGGTPFWYADHGLERDIDVLWMGKRGTRRRSDILDRVCGQLKSRGVNIYIADNELHPFVFGETRTKFLNRSKITLNITRTWYDDNFSRFALAAPNQSLIISEPMLAHCPEFQAGEHYVSVPIDQLVQTILYYLEHDDERKAIIDRAYQLTTGQLLFRNSLSRILDAVWHKQHQSNTRRT